MPRHVRHPTADRGKRAGFVAQLVNELREPSAALQPIILEDETPETETVRVQIVWQDWQDVSFEQRTAIILDAYDAAFGTERRSRITLALGYDFWEAKRIGLLPYSVRPSALNGTPDILARQHQLMREMGAPVEYSDHGPQLWFVTQTDAEAMKARLEAAMPSSKWTIIEEITRDEW